MNTFYQPPPPELSPFVDRIWGWESDSSEAIPLPTLLPGTGAELYFHYGEPFRTEPKDGMPSTFDRGHLFCIRKVPIELMQLSGVGFIAVRFKIGMLHRFTRIPAESLVDCQLAVEDIWGISGARLLQQLSYATGRQEMIALINGFLASNLQTDSVDYLVELGMPLLYRQWSSLSIDTLASTIGLGRRQLERRWRKFSGQSPSETKGLIRFQQAMRRLMLNASVSTTDTALACGYSDQAHFINDFRIRVGHPPQQYLRLARAKTHFYNTPLRKIGTLDTPNQ
jgi:AraC-like DNA-binding protein